MQVLNQIDFNCMGNKPTRILFVCMGNICRSPTVEAVTKARLREAGLDGQVEIDSAGTHAYHVGEPPDSRSSRHAAGRGYQMVELRARQVAPGDFHSFDLILVADASNLAELTRRCPPQHRHKLIRMLEWAGVAEVMDMPDPYYGGEAGFERVLDLCEQVADAVVGMVQADLPPRSSRLEG